MSIKSRSGKIFGLLLGIVLLMAALPVTNVFAQAADVGDALQSGADRLTALQNNDGGWDWPLDDGNPANASPVNTVGPIAKGLAEAYAFTQDPAHRATLQDAGVLLLTKINNFSPSDGYLAAALDEIFGGTTYVGHVVANFYGPLAAGTYDKKGAGVLYNTAAYVQSIRDSRSGDQANLAAWDIGLGLVGAASCGVTGTELQYWIDGVKAEINELDGSASYDVIGLAGAVYGLAFVDEDFDPIAGEHAAAASLADLAAILASYQINYGGFAWNSEWVIEDDYDESIQETAYAILALNEVDRAAYIANILGAADYMLSVQLETGGWQNDEYYGGENNEVTGEALWGISIAYPQLWVCQTGDCGYPGAQFSTIQAAIDAAEVGATINVLPGTYHEMLELRTPYITVKSTNGRDVTILDVPDGTLTTGVKVLANMGDVTFDGFTVKDFTESGIIQGMSARTGTTFHVLNNKVIPAADYLRNGIQVSGDGSTVIGNFVEGAYLTSDWASTAIGVVNASNVLVQGNEISGAVNGIDYGISVYNWNVDSVQNVQVLNNTIYQVDYPLDVTAYHGTVSDVTLEYNKVSDYVDALWAEPYTEPGYDGESVTNIDASPNWWGSAYGPLSPIYGEDVTVIKWCANEACTEFLPDDNNVISISGEIHEDNGIQINIPGLTFLLKDGTVIQNDSPCFEINADYTTITTESPLGAVCIPTGMSNGINVNGDRTNIIIEGLEIDGVTGTNGIDFDGVVTDLIIRDNSIHGLAGAGLYFAAAPAGVVQIQGNLFMDNTGNGIEAGALAIPAEFNAWGSFAGAAAVGGDGVSANVDADPWTHVDLDLEPSGSPWDDQLVLGEQITYEVKANLVNAMGADFVLEYPANLGVDSITLGGIFDAEMVDSTNAGELNFVGYQMESSAAVNASDVTLFTVVFDTLTTGKNLLMDFDEETDLFSMAPDTGGDPSTNIYATLLEDSEIDVILLPQLTSGDIKGYYLTGEPRNFSVRTYNPTEGAAYTNVIFRYTIYDADLTDIASFTNAGYGDMPLAEDGLGNLVGEWGLAPTGFAMTAPYDVTTTFNIEFNTAGDYVFELTLVDLTTDPDFVLATLKDTAKVYTKPTITSSDLIGYYLVGVDQDFTLTITNPDGLPEPFELVFELPAGTVITYGGTDYTCDATGCPAIPVSLPGASNDLTFTVNFYAAFNGNVTVTLFDSDWVPDHRPLAAYTETGVVAHANYDVTGTVSMQGRSVRSGVQMVLEGLYDIYLDISSSLISLNLGFDDVIADTYKITTMQDRYLNITSDLGITITIGADTELPALELKGGNAYDDDVINIQDAGIIGGQYGTGTIADDGDVNFDNRVNIQDLALVGGNYGLTAEAAYGTWLP